MTTANKSFRPFRAWYTWANSSVWIEFGFYLFNNHSVFNLIIVAAVHDSKDLVVFDLTYADQKRKIDNNL